MATTYPEWKRLNDLLEILKSSGYERLEADEIIEFGKLYRRAASELSFHRTHEADPARLVYLNDLVGRCYPYVYAAPRRPWPSVGRFFAADFPRAVRRHLLLIVLALLCSLIPAAIGFSLTWRDRAIADQVLPAGLMESLNPVVKRHQKHEDWLPLKESPEASGQIMTNNIQVSIAAFAGGMTAGLLTIFILIFNGIMLGVIAAAVALDGPVTALNFWAFVAPHGVLELTAIFISGGAGLILAYAIVNPGEFPRRVALKLAGREAMKLMLGVAAMLVVAGLIEAFFSPRNINELIKLNVACIEAILLLAYFAVTGRRAKEAGDTPFGELMTPIPPV